MAESRSPSIQATPSIYPIGGFGYYWPLTSHHIVVNPMGQSFALIGQKTIDFTHQ